MSFFDLDVCDEQMTNDELAELVVEKICYGDLMFWKGHVAVAISDPYEARDGETIDIKIIVSHANGELIKSFIPLRDL